LQGRNKKPSRHSWISLTCWTPEFLALAGFTALAEFASSAASAELAKFAGLPETDTVAASSGLAKYTASSFLKST
jgi:hypothetical protein